MLTTVYFAANRALTGPAEDWRSYGTGIVAFDPGAITYASAFIDNTDLTADTTGAITSIQNVQLGGFGPGIVPDLSDPGRNLLVFVHGFANTFENAITRAAFNREWLAQSGAGGAGDTTVVGFVWPSLGQVLLPPLLDQAYRFDQTMAGQSGFHLASFLVSLRPLLQRARANGSRVFLLAHSMGNWALQAAVESWFRGGNGDALLFDEAILAAADERFDTFDFPQPGRLSALSRLAARTSIYFSSADQILDFSVVINGGLQRLGQDGPRGRADTQRFPPVQYRMVDCTSFADYNRDFVGSHQYYRRSPGVRTDIAAVMAGAVA